MSISLILRDLVLPPYITKGSALEYDEMDTNLVNLAQAIQILQGNGTISQYSGNAYGVSTDQFIAFNNGLYWGLYLCIAPAAAGQSPAVNPSLWQEIGNQWSPAGSASGLTAHAGGGQGSATAITKRYNRFNTIASDYDSAILPTAKTSMKIFVFNPYPNVKIISIYPQAGEHINDQPNFQFSIYPGNVGIFECVDTGKWFSFNTTISSGS